MIVKILLIVFLLLFSVQIYAQTCNDYITATTPDSRFTTNGNEVTDNKTGLIWQRCIFGRTGNDCLTDTGTATGFTWYGAFQAAKLERQQTGINWRLPNIKEILSIIEERCFSPAVNLSIFPNPGSVAYWSSSSKASTLSNYSWIINLPDGNATGSIKNTPHVIRLVRTAQPESIFTSLPAILLLLF